MNKCEVLFYVYIGSWIAIVILLQYTPIVFIVIALCLGVVVIPLSVWNYIKDSITQEEHIGKSPEDATEPPVNSQIVEKVL